MIARLDLTQPELSQLLHIISCYPPQLRIEETQVLRSKAQLAGVRLRRRIEGEKLSENRNSK